MKTLSNADYNTIISILHTIAEGNIVKVNQRRKSKLIIKKYNKKYGKQSNPHRACG